MCSSDLVHTITIPGAGTGTITGQEFLFTTLIDTPTYTVKENGINVTKGYGYYLYVLELLFVSDIGSGTSYPTHVITNYLNFTAQVIKE